MNSWQREKENGDMLEVDFYDTVDDKAYLDASLPAAVYSVPSEPLARSN